MIQAMVNKGVVVPVEVPEPMLRPGCIKIKVLYSCISKGTEIKGVQESRKGILKMALTNPKKVRSAISMFKDKGLALTGKKIMNSADRFSTIGYSISGIVSEVAEGIRDIMPGDRVSAGGQGFAMHAETVVVPRNLVVKVPLETRMDYASIATVGSIALHGVRRADLRVGEFGVVYGVGLLGLLAVQIWKASGVRIACVDFNDSNLEISRMLGAELTINPLSVDPVQSVQNWTQDNGADAVLYAAATTATEPLSNSFKMSRKKGRVVVMGVAGMSVDRADVYKNEIDLLISTSYGPGRYDDAYEIRGHDYPYAYVRWTENRNIGEFIRLVTNGAINLDILGLAVYPITHVAEAYKSLESSQGPIIALLEYTGREFSRPKASTAIKETLIPHEKSLAKTQESKKVFSIGLIGAGSFATGYLLPIISSMPGKFKICAVANRGGDKALNVAREYGAKTATTSYQDLLQDPDIDLLMVCTRHGSHAQIVLEGLRSGKHVYVEKPLAVNLSELEQLEDFFADSRSGQYPLLMVGFNRRFSPLMLEVKTAIKDLGNSKFIRYRMNAGFIPGDSWVHEDGGRIIGEACHLIDLFSFLLDAEPREVFVTAMNDKNNRFFNSDNRSISIKYSDGSVGVLDYFACGSKDLAKEYFEIHAGGKSIIVDDYKTLSSFGVKINAKESRTPQKGHKEEWDAVYRALLTGEFPIPLSSLFSTTRTSIIASGQNIKS